MNLLAHIVKIGILCVVATLVAGCAGFGQLQIRCPYNCEQEVRSFLDAFSEYHVYFAGQDTDLPAGIVFDPRDDGRSIRPGKWKPLNDPEEARHVITILETDVQFPPKLYMVRGEQQAFYGYLYTPYQHVPVEQVAPTAVKLRYLRQPKHLQYDNGSLLFDPLRMD